MLSHYANAEKAERGVIARSRMGKGQKAVNDEGYEKDTRVQTMEGKSKTA